MSNSYALLGNASVQSYLTNGEASTVLCFVVKLAGSSQSTREVGRNTRLRQVFLPTSWVLWPLPKFFTTAHSTIETSLFVLYIKNPLKSRYITFNFQNKMYCQSKEQCRRHAPYSHNARHNKLIGILVIMVQIIWWLKKTKAVKSVKPSKFTICSRSDLIKVEERGLHFPVVVVVVSF